MDKTFEEQGRFTEKGNENGLNNYIQKEKLNSLRHIRKKYASE